MDGGWSWPSAPPDYYSQWFRNSGNVALVVLVFFGLLFACVFLMAMWCFCERACKLCYYALCCCCVGRMCRCCGEGDGDEESARPLDAGGGL